MKKAIIVLSVLLAATAVVVGVLFVSQLKAMEDNMRESEKSKDMIKEETFEVSDYEATYTDTLDSDFYMLLLGVDKDAERSQAEDFAGDDFRTDSIILAHVNTDEKKVALCSFERDLQIELEGYGTCKLNNAYTVGGIVGITNEVEKLSGVDISHYAAVDMDGLKELIDAVGGVEVDVEKPFFDDQINDGIETAGPQLLDGEKALVYARSRYPWENGDYDRARHQRDVIKSLAGKVSNEVNAVQKMGFLNKLSSYVATDLMVAQIFELASKMNGMDMEQSMYSMMTPATDAFIDGVSYQILDQSTWQVLLSAFKNLEDPSVVLAQAGISENGALSYTNKELADDIATSHDLA